MSLRQLDALEIETFVGRLVANQGRGSRYGSSMPWKSRLGPHAAHYYRPSLRQLGALEIETRDSQTTQLAAMSLRQLGALEIETA